ncbi:Protein takeout [Pseudolycoriella hygida]|uniref:Protein takeout n=1 Tax=Pseudolycoriella hygida TaxID=35572 RepID=A0A9Q0RXG2_9DIPT|nr:Protein takeout [Pseudolycoriella hygida]
MMLTQFDPNIFVTLVLFSVVVNCDNFPNSIARCKYADVKCIENAINNVIKSSTGGIPEIDLRSIDPLYIGKTSLEQGASTGPVNIKVRMKNANMLGVKHLVIDKIVGFEKDPNKSKFEIHGFCPSVRIVGTYQISGKVLVVPVNGHGLANISLYDNSIKMEFLTRTERKADGEYLIIDDILYECDSKRMTLKFENLFNDPVISASMNSFFNENQDILYKELKQSMNRIFGNIIKKRIQQVFRKFPYRDFFLD